MKEIILCAAIWYKDLPTQRFLAKNLDKGLLVCGHRHGHCFAIVKSLAGLRSVKLGPDSVGETEKGFLTNTNRFVNRQEAAQIAYKAGQIEKETETLLSEDLKIVLCRF